MGAGTVYEELDESKAEIENLKANYKIKLELSESLKRSNNEQLIKYQEAVLKIDKLSEEVNEKGALLEEAKVENEKLRENYQMKVEFSESLRRAHNEQLIKNQEAGLKIEKFSQELNEKIEEISIARQKYDELKLNLKEKDDLVKHMTTLNDKFHAETKEKIRKCEEENLRLGLALDEANAKNMQQEQLIKSLQFSESLRRAHQEQLIKNQEAGLKIEKLSQELHEKIEEISLTSQKYEELELKLKEKDALVKHLYAVNDKLRAESNEKIAKCEEENLQLGLALEEASANNMQEEQWLQSIQEEIQRFKGLASVSKSSCSEADSKSFKEERRRDDMLHKVEEEKSKYENQLKWKKEQFNHLQEAHEKLRSDFKVREREWETEKASLLDELSNLQLKLDSQIRLSESLKSRLEMCNNALSHAESKRKLLEVELSESRSNFGNVFAEYEEAKSTIENLTDQRDKEIARLRCSLGEKENLYKEMEYQVRMLEQEKKDLLSSLKELQEAGVHGEGHSSSLVKLRNKLKGLEQVHKNCSERFKAEESDWNSQMENLFGKLNCCNAELDSKIQLIDKLKQEVETRDSVIIELAMNNEEAAIMLLVLKSELSDAKLKFADAYAADLVQNDKEHKERVSLLIKLLDVKKIALREAQKQVEVERMKMAELTGMIASANSTEVWELSLLKEIERLKQELSESNAFQCELKKQNHTVENMLNEVRTTLQRTNEELDVNFCEATELDFELQVWKSIAQQLKFKLEEDHCNRSEVEAPAHSQMLSLKNHVKKLRRAMDRANEELAERFCEGNEVEFQLQIWKSIAEQLKNKLEENHHLRREVEASLLAQVGLELSLKQEKDNLSTLIEEKDNRIKSLEQELVLLSKELGKRGSSSPVVTSQSRCNGLEEEIPLQYVKESHENFQEEEVWVKRELEGAISVQVDAEKNYEHEKETLQQQVEERDQRIENLQQIVMSLEQEFESSKISFSLKMSEMQLEMNALHQTWNEVAASVFIKDMEIQEKNLIVIEMENMLKYEHEKETLQQQVEERDQRIENLQQIVRSLEQEFKSSTVSFSSKLSQMQLEINYFHQAWDEVATSVIMKEMEIQEKNLIVIEMENMLKLSSERLNQLCDEDLNLSERLGCIMQAFDTKDSRLDLKLVGDIIDPTKENINMLAWPISSSKADAILDQRLPFRAINN